MRRRAITTQVRGPARRRRCRPRAGHAQRARELGLDRVARSHDRSAHLRRPQGQRERRRLAGETVRRSPGRVRRRLLSTCNGAAGWRCLCLGWWRATAPRRHAPPRPHPTPPVFFLRSSCVGPPVGPCDRWRDRAIAGCSLVLSPCTAAGRHVRCENCLKTRFCVCDLRWWYLKRIFFSWLGVGVSNCVFLCFFE